MAKRSRKGAHKGARDGATGRITTAGREEILKQVDAGRSQVEVAEQYGIHPSTVSRWLRRREEAKKKGDASGRSGLAPRSTRPIDAASPVPPAQRDLVVELKREHPEMGPAQLRNQLRRFHGVSLSHKTIGKILKDAGIKLETRVADSEEKLVERFEMSRPNELWTMDIKELWLHDVKLHLFAVIDDYSRFVVGHRLVSQPSAEEAVGAVTEAMARHGKPERVLTDRGREFHVWGGASQFTGFLESELIAHSLARPYHPQTCGKIEALFGTVQKELLDQGRFDSVMQARRELARYFERYNFERTHMGIGGVTPADRYFGRTAAALGVLEKGLPSLERPGSPQRLAGERAVVLQLALEGGRVVLWLAGKRIELG